MSLPTSSPTPETGKGLCANLFYRLYASSCTLAFTFVVLLAFSINLFLLKFFGLLYILGFVLITLTNKIYPDYVNSTIPFCNVFHPHNC